jgi:ABC-2 type transport system ATP-binding protein
MSEVIRIDSVTKSFDLSAKSFNSLKEKVLLRKHKNSKSDFLAVNDVNIAVKEGETVGLIGHNGSGKSTLLKCVAGVLRPTSGRISTRGRLAALLELGAGMEPDLTARENIYLNGSLLGFSKKQIDTKFDEIIYFSELEKFIDTQVRFYSSGMQVRLGFSVAINVDPDILLIDEVLAVGDESFQRKCMSKIKSFQKEGKTIFFVSHSVDQVREICDRTIVMHHGSVLYDGNLSEGVRAYRETLLADEEKYREESTFAEENSLPDGIAEKYEKKLSLIQWSIWILKVDLRKLLEPETQST